MAEPFAVGACYTNEEIAAELGAAHPNYIRFVSPKRVVALCLNAWEHPRAPEEVWVGSGGAWSRVSRSAQWLVDQCADEPQLGIPLFIKDVATSGKDRSWCYHGRYRVVGDTSDEAALAAVKELGKTPVVRILNLERISD
jgi:hypothetical protein